MLFAKPPVDYSISLQASIEKVMNLFVKYFHFILCS